MNSLSELLPTLVILSPLAGAVVTAIIARLDPTQLRPTATANVTCTLLLLSTAFGQYELERSAEGNARLLSDQEGTRTAADIALRQSRHRKLDRLHAEYLSHRWLVVDGLNLWPTVVCAFVMAGLLWQGSTYKLFAPPFIPWALFFQAAIFGTLMANDLRAFLIAFELSVIAMGVLIGRWGGADRRALATRFLLVQFSAHLFVAFGLAMTITGLPWMKLDESTSTPTIIYKFSTIAFEIQTWVTNNQLAFQYAQEVFPFVILTLCLGFAIEVGCFPFHSSTTSIIGRTPVPISLLYISGFLAAVSTSWYRLVFPIAPDLLVRFDRILLFTSIVGAGWALICCLNRSSFRERTALAYVALSSLCLFGPYCLSQVSLCGGWLLQQQTNLLISLILTLSCSPPLLRTTTDDRTTATSERSRSLEIALMCMVLIGTFASGSGLVTELLREGIELPGLFVGLLVAALVLVASLVARVSSTEDASASPLPPDSGFSNRIASTLLLMMALVTNVVPQLMLTQCEPEFARVFRQFEKIAPASSARLHSDLRQTSPQVP